MAGSMGKVARTAVLAALGVVLVAAGCSGDDDTATGSDDSTATSAETSATGAPATSTRATVEAAEWGEDVGVEIGDATWTFTSNGIPNHERPDQYLVPVEGVYVPRDESDVVVVDDPTVPVDLLFELPLEPQTGAEPLTVGAGGVGVMISGATMFNPYEADGTTVALSSQITVDGVSFVDDCNGHPTPTGIYHYHGIPLCITDDLDSPGEHSHVVGVAFDGYPMYGPQGEGGEPPTDLDECLGHVGPTPEQPEGIYHYHLSEEEPYTLPCLTGEVDDLDSLAAQAAGAPRPDDGTEAALGLLSTGEQAAAGASTSTFFCSIGAPAVPGSGPSPLGAADA